MEYVVLALVVLLFLRGSSSTGQRSTGGQVPRPATRPGVPIPPQDQTTQYINAFSGLVSTGYKVYQDYTAGSSKPNANNMSDDLLTPSFMGGSSSSSYASDNARLDAFDSAALDAETSDDLAFIDD